MRLDLYIVAEKAVYKQVDRRFDYGMSSLEVLTHPSSVKSFFSRVLAKQIHITIAMLLF